MITHINPASLYESPAFSQATLVEGGKTLYVGEGQDPNAGCAASAEVWGNHRTAVTVLVVPRLGRPDALEGIEVVAAV